MNTIYRYLSDSWKRKNGVTFFGSVVSLFLRKQIAERQTNADHGAAIAEQFAADLRQEFPGVSGYSCRNVFYMREFYLAYSDLPKVQPLVAQIGWTHNLIILQRCKDPLEREFYIRMTRKDKGK